MKLINDLLDRYTNLKPPHDTVRRELQTVLKEQHNIDVPFEDIHIHAGIAEINAHPTVKNTIFMQKQRILKDLNRTNVHDIR